MYIEDAYTNLLFGVSQQAPQDRLPGQLSAQINMVSDLVAGNRRRAPLEVVASPGTYTDPAKVLVYNTDISGTSVAVIVDTGDGSVRVLNDSTGAVLANLQSNYLLSPTARDIRLVTLDDAVWLCNVAQMPTRTTYAPALLYPNPERHGFFYINSGAYSKQFSVTITNRANNTTATATYTTPDGTTPGDAAKATPEYIAEHLTALINTDWVTPFALAAYQTGAYVTLVSASASVTISSTSGNNFVRTSNAMSIRDVAELPARLSAQANNLICATGTGKIKVYYRYDDNAKVWLEDAAYDSMQTIGNTPLQMRVASSLWSLTAPQFERRTSGNTETNRDFKFLTDGITGMATFQGRLVLLSNEYANLSASNNPLRFFRSTLASLNDDDPIEVAAQGSLTAPYEYAVNFNKDLVMFSKFYQGVIPGGTMVTPRTANVALMTQYDVDTQAAPVPAGRSIFFGAPRSLGYVGVHEMVPSPYADSQYVADDVTSHIPRYMRGPWRFLTSSTTSNILVGGLDGEPTKLMVHQYLWAGQEKQHQAWHHWTLGWPVFGAYFSGDVLLLLLGVNGRLVVGQIDMQRGAGPDSFETPRLDHQRRLTCTTAGQLRLPAYVAAMGTDLRVFKVEGQDAFLGQKVFTVAPDGDDVVLTVPEAVPGDVYYAGFPYESLIELSPPVIKDRKEVPTTTSRAVIHRYSVSVYNTGQFRYALSDQARTTPIGADTTPQRLFSGRIGAGQPMVDSSTVRIPARLDMRTVAFKLYTSDYYDMNVLSIEYGYRFNQRHRR